MGAPAHRRTRPLFLAALLVALAGAGFCNMLIPSRLDLLRETTQPVPISTGSQTLLRIDNQIPNP